MWGVAVESIFSVRGRVVRSCLVGKMPSTYVSKLSNAVQNGVQRLVVGNEGRIHGSFESLIGQGRFGSGNFRLFHSVRVASLAELQILVRPAVAASDSLLVNRRKDISVVGAVSRTFSVPSVSSCSVQACGYHIDRALSDPDKVSASSREIQKKPMDVFVSGATIYEGLLKNLTSRREHLSHPNSNAFSSYGNRLSLGCKKISRGLKNGDRSSNSTSHGYFAYNVGRRVCNFSQYMEPGFGHLHSSASVLYSDGTAPGIIYGNSTRKDQLESATVSPEQKIPAVKNLKLLSGSCYLPHPDKEETGGEDAHFICSNEQAIGVADGVGGWADMGIDSGLYSRELMSNSVNAIQEEPKGSIDPARVLEKAHSRTKAKGSSTACIIALTEQGLTVINLGDSGFVVVRDGHTVFRSPVQQHSFNFTYQLENGNDGDMPRSGQVFSVPVAPGDVIVAGTDGLFDNLYINEITAIVVHAIRAGLNPQVTAQKIAALARQRAHEKDRQTPFSTAAQEAGFRYHGGKLDDITVVVSYVSISDEEHRSSPSV